MKLPSMFTRTAIEDDEDYESPIEMSNDVRMNAPQPINDTALYQKTTNIPLHELHAKELDIKIQKTLDLEHSLINELNNLHSRIASARMALFSLEAAKKNLIEHPITPPISKSVMDQRQGTQTYTKPAPSTTSTMPKASTYPDPMIDAISIAAFERDLQEDPNLPNKEEWDHIQNQRK